MSAWARARGGVPDRGVGQLLLQLLVGLARAVPRVLVPTQAVARVVDALAQRHGRGAELGRLGLDGVDAEHEGDEVGAAAHELHLEGALQLRAPKADLVPFEGDGGEGALPAIVCVSCRASVAVRSSEKSPSHEPAERLT